MINKTYTKGDRKLFLSFPKVKLKIISEHEPWRGHENQDGVPYSGGYQTALLSRLSSKSFQQLNKFASCRSWSTDIYQGILHDIEKSDFNFDTMRKPTFRFLYQAMIIHDHKCIPLGLKFVNSIEDALGVPRTKCFRANNKFYMRKEGVADILITQADRYFSNNPFLTSLYQLMWKIASNVVIKEYDKDFDKLTEFVEIVEKLKEIQLVKGVTFSTYISDLYNRRNCLINVIKRTLKRNKKFFDYNVKVYNKYYGDLQVPDIHSEAGIGNFCRMDTFSEKLNEILVKSFPPTPKPPPLKPEKRNRVTKTIKDTQEMVTRTIDAPVWGEFLP